MDRIEDLLVQAALWDGFHVLYQSCATDPTGFEEWLKGYGIERDPDIFQLLNGSHADAWALDRAKEALFDGHSLNEKVSFPLLATGHERNIYWPADGEGNAKRTTWDEEKIHFMKVLNQWATSLQTVPINAQTLYHSMQLFLMNFPSPRGTDVLNVSFPQSQRLLGALAVCEYRQRQENAHPSASLVVLDWSGIQKFIYTAQGSGVLKSLRARSFYLELLEEAVALDTLKLFQLPEVNVIYQAGGVALLMIPNEADASIHPKIEQTIREWNRYFWQTFREKIYMAYGIAEFSLGEARQIQRALKNAFREVSNSKNHRWKDHGNNDDLHHIFYPQGIQNGFVEYSKASNDSCEVCGIDGEHAVYRLEGNEEAKLCHACYTMWNLGRHLGDANLPPYFYAYLGYLHEHDKDDIVIDIKNYTFYFPKHHVNRTDALRYRWKNFERATPEERLFPLAMIQGFKENLSDLAERGIGEDDIGVLRMDVDSLGEKFIHAGTDLFQLAELSYRMNYYFKRLMPKRLAKTSREESLFFGNPSACKVLYAGGDDLFLVGAWQDVIEAGRWIRKDFDDYFHYGSTRQSEKAEQAMTISGGIAIAHPKVPFYKLAATSGENEDIAKEGEKNKLGIWDTAYEWDTFQPEGTVYRWLSVLLRYQETTLVTDNGNQILYINSDYPRTLLETLREMVHVDETQWIRRLPYLVYSVARWREQYKEFGELWELIENSLINATTIVEMTKRRREIQLALYLMKRMSRQR